MLMTAMVTTAIVLTASLMTAMMMTAMMMTAIVITAGSEWQGRQRQLPSNAVSSSRARLRICSSISKTNALAWLVQSSRHAFFQSSAFSACFILRLTAHVMVACLKA